MTQPTGDLTTCRRCNNSGVGDPRDWHHYRHPYEGPWKSPSSSPQSPVPPMGGGPGAFGFDPVLRLALVDAGIITTEQLNAAQSKLYAMTGNHPLAVMEVTQHDVPGRSSLDGE